MCSICVCGGEGGVGEGRRKEGRFLPYSGFDQSYLIPDIFVAVTFRA